ncbi:MAG: nucleotidyltransferase domain-containing protein [Candidatus Omnitrophica bacterium]|nr:nucleotidyltransferase domain-containing protein [Candidatus Omnitrophota bacterium]
MRRIISSGSVKCISIDKEALLEKLRKISTEAVKKFPEIEDIRIFGSIAKNKQTGLSDVDIIIISKTHEMHPIERIKPYFNFFSEHLDIAIDLLVARPEELNNFKDILKESFSLLKE